MCACLAHASLARPRPNISAEGLHFSAFHYTGNVQIELRRYLKDARSIPVAGDSSGQAGIGPESRFSIDNDLLYLTDPENGSTCTAVGTHMQYLVTLDSVQK